MSFADATHGWGLTPGTAGVVQTDDGGQSWTTPSQPCRDPFKTPVTLAVHPSAGVWVVCTDGSTDLTSVGISVMVSINGGRSWEQRVARGGGIAVGNIPTRGFPTGLSVGRDGFAWMWGTEIDLLASSDGGHTWTAANTGLMQPTALIAASHPGAGHDLALFLDRGERMTHLEETSNGGTTWVERFRWVLAPSASLPVVHATSTPAPQAPRSTTYLRWSMLPMPWAGALQSDVTASSVGIIAVAVREDCAAVAKRPSTLTPMHRSGAQRRNLGSCPEPARVRPRGHARSDGEQPADRRLWRPQPRVQGTTARRRRASAGHLDLARRPHMAAAHAGSDVRKGHGIALRILWSDGYGSRIGDLVQCGRRELAARRGRVRARGGRRVRPSVYRRRTRRHWVFAR
jgi:hypothetical protein